MKAVVYTHYGPPDVLQFRELPVPTPADNEVLVRVCAVSINPLDWHLMRGDPLPVRLMTGLLRPKKTVLGSDFAGRVEAVGEAVKQFKPGDEVFGGVGQGGFAEYVCAAEDRLALKPANLSFEEAAAVPVAALTALQGLRMRGRMQAGSKVLVDGASGGVGTFGVQIAKALGAEVTAVCSTRNVETARRLGADHVIDYTQQDFTRMGQQYDLILAANAYRSIFDYRRALREDGVCVRSGGRVSFSAMAWEALVSLVLRPFSRKRVCGFITKWKQADLLVLRDLLASGRIAPVIDRRYPFSAMTEAIGYLEEGHAQGKVVLTVE